MLEPVSLVRWVHASLLFRFRIADWLAPLPPNARRLVSIAGDEPYLTGKVYACLDEGQLAVCRLQQFVNGARPRNLSRCSLSVPFVLAL